MRIFGIILLGALLLGATKPLSKSVDLTVTVQQLRNNTGVVQFALYNKKGSIPDEHYENFYKLAKSDIKNNSATVVFTGLPPGMYAVNILHDENNNGQIEKGFILPVEGIGFSNYTKIGFGNRPNFTNASFKVLENKTVSVKAIYF